MSSAFPSLRYTGNNYGGTIGGPIWKNKTFFFFDWDGTRSSNLGTYQAGVPSAAERTGQLRRNMRREWRLVQFGWTLQRNCRARSTILTPAPFKPQPMGLPAPIAAPIFHSITWPTYTSPGNPNLNGTPYQLPIRPGNLIDPVAQKMLNLFPMPNIAGRQHLRQLDRIGSDAERQRPVRHQDRPPLQRKEFVKRQILAGMEQQQPLQLLQKFRGPLRKRAEPRRGAPVRDQRYAHFQSDSDIEHDAGLHAGFDEKSMPTTAA